jgi:hypothetical protein
MKTEMMRKLFEAEAVRRSYDITQTHGAGNYDWGNTAIFYAGFQAACNMFLPFVDLEKICLQITEK